jgi:hypothetical protein
MLKDIVCAIVAMFFGLALLVTAENEIVPSFHTCISQKAAQQSAENADHKAPAIIVTIGIIEIQALCSVRLVDRHPEFFATVATLAIATFTFTLWLATTRLWLAKSPTRNSSSADFRAREPSHEQEGESQLQPCE